jgi:sodium-dependent dicarboxylate transporter 2/3/5
MKHGKLTKMWRLHEARVARRRRIPESIIGYLGISSPKRIVIFFVCLTIALAVALIPALSDSLEPPARRALFILVLAAGLWMTEAIPAFAVGILVIGLEIALLGTTRGGAQSPKDWEQYVAILGHPLVWLFFGGFVLAAGMSKSGLDRRLAVGLLKRLGTRPEVILAGVMAVTFVLSMFISNTATAAMMLAMLAPLMAAVGEKDPYGKALLLGIALAANVGGMASLIGTPPNAIAVGALSDLTPSVQIDFLRWIVVAGPVAVLVAVLGWLTILRLYPPQVKSLLIENASAEDKNGDVPPWKKVVVGFVFVLTVGLWMTSQWHSIPTAAVSFVPIVLLTMTGVLDNHDIRGLNYDVLFLLAGGMALGNAVVGTGLSTWLVSGLPTESMGFTGVTLMVCYLAVVLSNLMSNTAAANIIVPLSLAMAVGAEPRIALPVAMSASAAMCLPIATPPNALAYASGRLSTGDFVGVGLVVGLITPILSVLCVSLWY